MLLTRSHTSFGTVSELVLRTLPSKLGKHLTRGRRLHPAHTDMLKELRLVLRPVYVQVPSVAVTRLADALDPAEDADAQQQTARRRRPAAAC